MKLKVMNVLLEFYNTLTHQTYTRWFYSTEVAKRVAKEKLTNKDILFVKIYENGREVSIW